MSFLDRIVACHHWHPEDYRPFLISGVRYGRVRHEFAERLAEFPRVFEVGAVAVRLSDRLTDFAARTEAVAEVLLDLRESGELPFWREEAYPVTRSWGSAPMMTMERGAVPQFGMRAYGVHMNGIVARADGLHVWVARRSMSKQTYPGELDNMVAGGQPHGLGITENLIKECAEEAGIGRQLAGAARPVGLLAYICEQPDGLRDDIAYCYDLVLPEDFRPRNQDGEVEEFQLWPIEHAVAVVRDTDDFKFNSALVMIDLFVRHGVIGPDDADYQPIVMGLGSRADQD